MTTVKQDLFIVNGNEVNEEDWSSLSEALASAHESAINVYTADNELTHDEIVSLMDKNRNGLIDCSDFNRMNTGGFRSLQSILKKHGVDLYDEMENNIGVQTESGTIPEFLWSDREFALRAVGRYGILLEYANEYKNDREVALAAIRQCDGAIRHIDGALLRDKEFILQAARENIGILQTSHLNSETKVISDDTREYVWGRIRNENAERFSELFGDAELNCFADFERALKERYNIEWISRFRSVDNMLKVLELRYDPSTAQGRTAIMISAKADWKGSFAMFPAIDRLMELGFNVLYYEVDREDEAASALNNATSNGSRPAEMLVLTGHGNPNGIELSETPQDNSSTSVKTELFDETRAIDVSDLADGQDELHLSRYIISGGDLLLNSCSNGKDGEKNPRSIANTVARTVPSVRVISATEKMNIKNLSFRDGHIEVEWTRGEVYIPFRKQ